jgi:hypothetical protein
MIRPSPSRFPNVASSPSTVFRHCIRHPPTFHHLHVCSQLFIYASVTPNALVVTIFWLPMRGPVHISCSSGENLSGSPPPTPATRKFEAACIFSEVTLRSLTVLPSLRRGNSSPREPTTNFSTFYVWLRPIHWRRTLLSLWIRQGRRLGILLRNS